MRTLVFLCMALLSSCASESMITGTWKSTAPELKNYNNVLVAAFTSNTVAKATVEEDLANRLISNQVNASKSIDIFPPSMNANDTNHAALMKKVRENGYDAILTVSLLRKETESRYIPGRTYDPFFYPYYGSFWGYYSHWYPLAFDPGYYSESTVYYIETNLYDAKTEKLAWSAQSKTYDVLTLPEFSKQFAEMIVNRLKRDGIIKTNGVKNSSTSDDVYEKDE